MDAKQTKIVLGSIFLLFLIWLAVPLFGRRAGVPGAAEQIQARFDAAQALLNTRDFVTHHPRRVIGSIEARQSTGFLQKRFQELGYATSYAHFDATISGRRQVGRNIYAFKQGQTTQIPAVVAHYDTAGTTVQGAMDDGSGVGVLLELARLTSALPTRRSLLFIASDGEEWGMLGVRDLVANYSQRDRIAAVISLDYVAIGELAELRLDEVGQMGGYTPPWLRRLARRCAEQEGVPVSEPAGFREHLERALLLSWTDQGPFLKAGTPAINLSGSARDGAREYRVYHSAQDTIENMNVESFAKYGRAAECILCNLDALPAIPQESEGALRAVDNIFLPGFLVVLCQILSFVPFMIIVSFHVANHWQYITLERVQREASSFLGTIFPFLLIFPIIRMLAYLRQLPRYSFYPATPKDPVLQHPAWGVALGILIPALATAVGCWFLVRFLNRKLPRADFHVSKSILLVFFLSVVMLALIYNSYWAASFLLLPALFWGLVGFSSGAGARAANRIIILVVGSLCVMVSGSCFAHLGLGWNLFWYEVLALSTGMFSWQAYLLSSATMTLGIRFLLIQSQGAVD